MASTSSDNPSSMEYHKIICQSQTRLKIRSHQQVDGNATALRRINATALRRINATALRRINEMKKVGFLVFVSRT